MTVSTKLGLSSLVDRRAMANLKFLSKLIDGFIDAPEILSLINFKVPAQAW